VTTTVDLGALLEEREWRKCAPSPDASPFAQLEAFRYFCEKYWFVKHPDKGRTPFVLFDSQVESVDLWLRNRYSLMLKARQLGFSTLVATYAFWLSFFYSDRVIIMLSRTERDAVKLLQKAKYGYRFLPEWMRFRGPPVNMTQTKIEFANESYIESLPSASDPARGESVYLAVVDELAYLPNSEEAWASIEPIADIGGRVVALSTANGEGNLFHKLWVGSTTGANRFASLFHPWWSNGRDQAWYDEKKSDLPEWQMAQEYPDNPEDAFLKSGRPVFSLEVLRKIETVPPLKRGLLEKLRSWQFVEQADGPLLVWSLPYPEGRYVVGADVAEGMEHGDFTSAHVINARNGEVVAHWHGRIDPDLFGSDVLAPLGRWYGDALIGVENNNHGLTTLSALRRLRYHPMYMQRSPRYKRSVPTEIMGYRTSQVTKPIMMDELNQALRDGSLKLWHDETVAELRTFVRNDANKMQGSPFDDRTISLAIANQMLHHVWLREYEPHREPGPGTMAWMERQLYGDMPLESEAPGVRWGEPKSIGARWVRDPIYTIKPHNRDGA
jgi:Terminase large subunit, T4likevirus-type, N-terminal